jgi:hypothetical protein
MSKPAFKQEIQHVISVARKQKDETKVIWYGWYAIVCCTDKEVAWTVRARCKRLGDWAYELKPGKKHKNNWYLKIIFKEPDNE